MIPKTVDSNLEFWRAKLDKPCFVYAFGAENVAVKIGVAIDPHSRRAELQTGSFLPLKILRVVPGDRKLEWQLHKRLVKQRSQGEWFYRTEETEAVLALMEKLAHRMRVEYHEGPCDGDYPDFRQYDEGPWINRDKRKGSEVVVRFEDPASLRKAA